VAIIPRNIQLNMAIIQKIKYKTLIVLLYFWQYDEEEEVAINPRNI
jgi:hypothetical protein